MILNIRNLKASEIECRPQIIKNNGCSLVLYKDARADMKILDETFGINGWKRSHEEINGSLYCTVSIWDQNKKEWIDKQDVGTEGKSNDFKEKSLASDAFKRACVNIGIGRELYTAPFIWIKLNQNEIKVEDKKYYLDYNTQFKVQSITYSFDREIEKLTIIDNDGVVRFNYDKKSKAMSAQSVNIVTEKPASANSVTHMQTANNDLQEAFNTIVAFGKYSGKNLSFIYNSDHQYFDWLKEKTSDNKVKKACEVIEHAM